MRPIPSPPSPVMLYIGAGYDLSPLLTFAPGGSPYPIVPQGSNPDDGSPSYDKYTSFLFVDAKPRHTSAFMVSDFHEWTSVEARVKNVIYYAQGALSRWRMVPGAPDLIWFEGGGDDALVASRKHDSTWSFSALSSSSSTIIPRPLTTLLYVFNTLDVELVRSPLLENVWPAVEALYVHGLQIHTHTGSGLPAREDADIRLGLALKRCYVIVRSWGTPGGTSGVRHVDFVRAARRRRTANVVPPPPLPPLYTSASKSTTLCSLSSSPTFSCGLPASPLVFRRPRRQLCDSDLGDISDSDDDDSTLSEVCETFGCTCRMGMCKGSGATSAPDLKLVDASTKMEPLSVLGSTVLRDALGSSPPPVHVSPLPTPPLTPSRPPRRAPFHVRIPQVAWSPSMRGGQGGYYVAKSVHESLAIWRMRDGEGSEEDESEEEDVNLSWAQRRASSLVSSSVNIPTADLRRRLRARPATPAVMSDSDTDVSDDEAGAIAARARRFWPPLALRLKEGRRGRARTKESRDERMDITAFLSEGEGPATGIITPPSMSTSTPVLSSYASPVSSRVFGRAAPSPTAMAERRHIRARSMGSLSGWFQLGRKTSRSGHPTPNHATSVHTPTLRPPSSLSHLKRPRTSPSPAKVSPAVVPNRRAQSHASSRRFRSAPDAPPVPPLPSWAPASAPPDMTSHGAATAEEQCEWDWLGKLRRAARARSRPRRSAEDDRMRVDDL